MSRDAQKGRDQPGAEYEVGYGKPPKHSRFQPGRSGNPSGKRRRDLSFDELAEKVFSEEHEVRIGADARKAPMAEIILAAQARKAASGDTKAFNALRPLLEKLRRAGSRDMTDEELTKQLTEELTPEDIRRIDSIRDELSRYLEPGAHDREES